MRNELIWWPTLFLFGGRGARGGIWNYFLFFWHNKREQTRRHKKKEKRQTSFIIIISMTQCTTYNIQKYDIEPLPCYSNCQYHCSIHLFTTIFILFHPNICLNKDELSINELICYRQQQQDKKEHPRPGIAIDGGPNCKCSISCCHV